MQYQKYSRDPDSLDMNQQSDRLRWARIKRRFANAAEAARAFGWNYPTYAAHENGNRPLTVKAAKKYAKAYGVNWLWLHEGIGESGKRLEVRVMGYVGAGAVVNFVGEDDAVEWVEVPPGYTEDICAVRVTGTSMMPAFEPNDIVYYEPDNKPPEEFLNKTCVILLKDGRAYIKKIIKGSSPGVYTLFSHDGELIPDVEIEWASRISWIHRD